mgnify:CR=1 FL=1
MRLTYLILILSGTFLFSCESKQNKRQPVTIKKTHTYTHPQTKEYPSTFSFSKVILNMGYRGTKETNKAGKIYVKDGQLMISFGNDVKPARSITSVGMGVPLEDGKYSYNYTLYYMGNIRLTEFVDKNGKPYKFKFTLSNGWTEDYFGK